MSLATKPSRRRRRRRRVRAKVSGTPERPRLSVYRSNRGIQAQLVDDAGARTLASVVWTEEDLKGLGPMDQAHKAGELIARRGKDAGVEACVFDRGGYKYHGRVRALAEAAREEGLTF